MTLEAPNCRLHKFDAVIHLLSLDRFEEGASPDVVVSNDQVT
jgi:hypothetical protein